MFCEECGQRAEPSTKFCTTCGMPLGNQSSAPASSTTAADPSLVPTAPRSTRLQWPFIVIVAALVAGIAGWAFMSMKNQPVEAAAPVPSPVDVMPSTASSPSPDAQEAAGPTGGKVPEECVGMIGKPLRDGQYIVIWEQEDFTLDKSDYKTIAAACRRAQELYGQVAGLQVLDSEDYEGRNLNTWRLPAMWTSYTGPYASKVAAQAACSGSCNVRRIQPCRTDGSPGPACG